MAYFDTAAQKASSKLTLPEISNHGCHSKRRLIWIAFEFVILTLMITMVPLVVYFDVVLLSGGMKEESLTEFLHSTLLLVTIGFLARAVFKFNEARGYLLLGATFFSCLFIREQDAYLDPIVKGFWKFPTLIVLIVGMVLVYRNRKTLVGPWLQHFETRSATFIYIGVLLLLAFTRTFGTGALWEAVLGENYTHRFKSVVQEGLELMSYTLIAYGAFTSYISGFGLRKPR